MKKWVTVVIPVYNTEKYLEECLSSVVKQTIFSKLEIICINDGSLDRSFEILKRYSQNYKNIKVINLFENVGLSRARNIGINEAQGEYVAFLDSDDFVDITMYEKLYIKAKENNYDIVGCDYFEYISGKVKYFSSMENITGEIDIEKRKKLILNAGGHSVKVFKLELFKNKKIRFPENLFYEDSYFVEMILMNCKRIAKISEALYFYRRENENSISLRIDNYRYFDRLITSKLLLKDLKEIDMEEYGGELIKEIEFLIIDLYFISSMIVSNDIKRFSSYPSSYVKKIKKEIKKLIPNYNKNIYFKKYIKEKTIKEKIKIFLILNGHGIFRKLKKLKNYFGE